MKLYIASHSREYARLVMNEIERAGHECTSRWIAEDAKFESGDYSAEERKTLALMDEEDVRRGVDGLILLAEATGHLVPGGKHVETGIALGLGYSIYVVGRRENLFHWHPRAKVFVSTDELLAHLAHSVGFLHSDVPQARPERV
jgi:hypothetical protein